MVEEIVVVRIYLFTYILRGRGGGVVVEFTATYMQSVSIINNVVR